MSKPRKRRSSNYFTWRFYHKCRDAWYYLKCLLFKRYNVVKARDLPPTWIDRCDLILYINFQILVDFVEKERPFDVFDTDEHKEEWDRIKALYNWWKHERPKIDDEIEHIAEYAIRINDDRMLAELVRLRHFLWT